MLGIDEHLLGLGPGLVMALAAAFLLGLRHATDPDHLVALSTLVLGEGGVRRAAWLGLAWGAGHALTVVVLGVPVVLFSQAIPEWAQQAAELTVAMVIVVLAVRLLVRWRRESFRAGVVHRAAFGIGLVHGAGGSAGVGILLIAAIDTHAEAVTALLLFASGTAVSMALCSAAWGRLLISQAPRLSFLTPALGTASLAFGCWYGVGSLG